MITALAHRSANTEASTAITASAALRMSMEVLSPVTLVDVLSVGVATCGECNSLDVGSLGAVVTLSVFS
jgi:hypothetical protein